MTDNTGRPKPADRSVKTVAPPEENAAALQGTSGPKGLQNLPGDPIAERGVTSALGRSAFAPSLSSRDGPCRPPRRTPSGGRSRVPDPASD